jgi:hypothetical protein
VRVQTPVGLHLILVQESRYWQQLTLQVIASMRCYNLKSTW